MKRQTIRGYMDLEYVILLDVPVRSGKFGPVIEVKPEVIERRIAEEIISQKVPLRGREIAFLRKVLGLSYEKLANGFGRSASSVFKWERDPEKRLDQLAEAAMRSFFAEQLNLNMRGWFHDLVSQLNKPQALSVDVSKVA